MGRAEHHGYGEGMVEEAMQRMDKEDKDGEQGDIEFHGAAPGGTGDRMGDPEKCRDLEEEDKVEENVEDRIEKQGRHDEHGDMEFESAAPGGTGDTMGDLGKHKDDEAEETVEEAREWAAKEDAE